MTRANEKDTYIFDMDGTLISFPVQWETVRSELKELTGANGEFVPVFPTIESIVSKHPELRKPILDTIDKHEVAAVPRASLHDGAFDALATLAGRGRKLSLVTMQGRAACSRILDKFEISNFLSSSFTREDSLDRSSQLRMALESVRATPDRSVFIADRINDQRAAESIGIDFVMISHRGNEPQAGKRLFMSMREFYDCWVVSPADGR